MINYSWLIVAAMMGYFVARAVERRLPRGSTRIDVRAPAGTILPVTGWRWHSTVRVGGGEQLEMRLTHGEEVVTNEH